MSTFAEFLGRKEWRNSKGKYHRLDGPALEFDNGDKRWYKDGRLHREDGPALEYANGNKHWYKEGLLHRKDGPVVEYAGGDKWWITNKYEIFYNASGNHYKICDYYSNLLAENLQLDVPILTTMIDEYIDKILLFA